MSKLITSDIMKGAIQQLFDHEVERNGRCSSHSQLERWVIEELKHHSPSNTVLALTKVLYDTRGIIIDMGDVDDDMEILKSRYAEYGLHLRMVGGVPSAFKYYSPNDDSHHCLVTTQEGDDIPASMNEPVTFELYNQAEDLLFYQEFEDSVSLFSDKHITYMLSI
jgi:hypothetical protein